MSTDFFSLSAGAGHCCFLTSPHYTSFVCTNEGSCSPVTDLKRLTTTDCCRNSPSAQEIKDVWFGDKEPVGVKRTEVDEKIPNNSSGTRNSPLLPVANGDVPSCLLALWPLDSSRPKGQLCSPAAQAPHHRLCGQSSHHKVVS